MVTQAANAVRGRRPGLVRWSGVLDMRMLLMLSMTDRGQATGGCSERGGKGRGYSAATTTTATTRDAAQIDCAALGEHELEAGGHVGQLTQ